MNKKDLILYILIGLLYICSLGFTLPFETEGELVQIYVDRELFAEYSVNENKIFEVEGYNDISLTIDIRNGAVDVIESDCNDNICENTKIISKTNESIICLPGRIVISIESDNDAEYDVISR